MEELNEAYDDMITDKITEQLNDNKDELSRELIKKIPLTHTYTNSVNIAVGRQRTGKSFSILKEIIKISNVHPETHLFIYVNQSGSDKSDSTMSALNKLITVPIVCVTENEFIPLIKSIIAYKELYNTIKDQHLVNS